MRPLPPGWVAKPFAGGCLAVPASFAAVAGPAWFDPNRPGAVTVREGGRQAAWFVDGVHGPAVLRHYRRGGLRARLGRESYFWLSAARVRAFAEVRMLAHLARAPGVQVPEPLGAAFWHRGLFYRNAILVRRIDAVATLARRLDVVDPAAVAHTIRAMHAAGVWHADLNATNILVDAQGAIWLIDFDRARLGLVSPAQAQQNLQRLRRSLVKLAGSRGEAWWQALARAWSA